MSKKKILIAFLSISSFCLGDENITPLPVGNFSVAPLTQISPLISFGQLLIGQNALLPELGGDYGKAHNNYKNMLTPDIVYGILDELSATLFLPYTLGSQADQFDSTGFGDLVLQLEYGFFQKSDFHYSMQATVVGNVQFPTGSATKTPPTGAGIMSYFIGSTFSYLSKDWYFFTSSGAYLTLKKNNQTKFGNSYLYQAGIARYIEALSPKGWVFDLMIEFNGTYDVKDEIYGITNPNSGGNNIAITPSIWLSSDVVILQLGVSLPLLQQLNGIQTPFQYGISYNLGVGFQF
jgi:hypothetical protein